VVSASNHVKVGILGFRHDVNETFFLLWCVAA